MGKLDHNHHHHHHHHHHLICDHGGRRGLVECRLLVAALVTIFSASSYAAGAFPLHYCHRLDASPRRFYATKTSYDDVRLHQNDVRTQKTDNVQHDNEDVEEEEEEEEMKKKNGASSSEEIESYKNGCSTGGGGEHSLSIDDDLLMLRWNDTLGLRNGFAHCQKRSSSNTAVVRESDDCEAVSVYLLARHGTRYNKFMNMQRMSEKLLNIQDLINQFASKGTMCSEDLNWLKKWKSRHRMEDDSKLSRSGWMELLEIGRRYGELFPDVLRRVGYSPSRYEFLYTNYTGKGDRTRQSAKAFAEGIWGRSDNVQMTENQRPDWLLQFYEYCRKYLRIVSANPVEDYENFKTGPEMSEVIRDVNTRLGLSKGTLGFAEVYLIFENCRLEHGLYRDSPWCSVLTPAMLEVIEYHQDVKYYYEDSYGHSISYEPACTLIKDIMMHLQDPVTLGRFRFAHSGTLDALYTRIGLYEDDEPLRANNFQRHRTRRRWTTSLTTPMAANIAFVKYRCLARGGGRSLPPLYRVKVIINENVLSPPVLPGCGSELCPLERLLRLWRPIAESCDINRICEQDAAAAAADVVTTSNNDHDDLHHGRDLYSDHDVHDDAAAQLPPAR